jgi:putative serine protease PepD
MRRFFTGLAGGIAGTALLLGVATVVGIGPLRADAGTTVVNGTQAAFTTSGLTPQQIYQQNTGGVVEVKSTFAGTMDIFGQSSGGGQGIGTGFVVSKDGYILTNAHVVSESGQTASDVKVTFKGSGDQTTDVAATIAGVDETTDVALLKIDPSQAPTLTLVKLGDSSKVAVGESVVAIGNPLGLDFSLSTGVVSAVGREIQSPNGATITNAIQTDASINPGNSGGPLFDSSGAVIGINEQIASQSGGNEGIGFAVPINTAVQVMEQMKSGSFQPSQSQAQSGQSQVDPSQGYGQIDPSQGIDPSQIDPSQIW